MRKRSARAKKKLAAQTADKVDRRQDIGLVDGALPSYQPLSEDAVDQVVNAALELIRDTGIGFDIDTHMMDIFVKAGCQVSREGVVRFPSDLVDEAIRSTSRSTRLWNWACTEFITLDKHHTWFFAGMTGIKVYDELTGEPRDSSREDLVKITQLVDALAFCNEQGGLLSHEWPTENFPGNNRIQEQENRK